MPKIKTKSVSVMDSRPQYSLNLQSFISKEEFEKFADKYANSEKKNLIVYITGGASAAFFALWCLSTLALIHSRMVFWITFVGTLTGSLICGLICLCAFYFSDNSEKKKQKALAYVSSKVPGTNWVYFSYSRINIEYFVDDNGNRVVEGTSQQIPMPPQQSMRNQSPPMVVPMMNQQQQQQQQHMPMFQNQMSQMNNDGTNPANMHVPSAPFKPEYDSSFHQNQQNQLNFNSESEEY